MSDEAKKKILARRASFVAAALAGVAACGKEPAETPQPCLSVAMPQPDAGPPPQPCLSPMPATAQPDDSPPQPCLSVMAPPDPVDAGQPKPCLKIKPP